MAAKAVHMSKSKVPLIDVNSLARTTKTSPRNIRRWVKDCPYQPARSRPLAYDDKPEIRRWFMAKKNPRMHQNEHTLASIGLTNFCAYLKGKRDKGDKLNPPIVEHLIGVFRFQLGTHYRWLVELYEEYRAAGCYEEFEKPWIEPVPEQADPKHHRIPARKTSARGSGNKVPALPAEAFYDKRQNVG